MTEDFRRGLITGISLRNTTVLAGGGGISRFKMLYEDDSMQLRYALKNGVLYIDFASKVAARQSVLPSSTPKLLATNLYVKEIDSSFCCYIPQFAYNATRYLTYIELRYDFSTGSLFARAPQGASQFAQGFHTTCIAYGFDHKNAKVIIDDANIRLLVDYDSNTGSDTYLLTIKEGGDFVLSGWNNLLYTTSIPNYINEFTVNFYMTTKLDELETVHVEFEKESGLYFRNIALGRNSTRFYANMAFIQTHINQ